ncbi:MAG: hypothetical protein IPJ85_08105 [Flavobacteriales bacterium]|nr:hypothetical protein [Flavobacteriales bacterium]
MKNSVLFAFALTTAIGSATAQPTVDVVLADNGNNQLEVRLRPTGSFDGVISNLVFTLRWQEQMSPALSMIGLIHPQSEYLPIGPLPLLNAGNGFQYRTFNAVALVPMQDLGRSWEGGVEYPVCTLDVLIPGVEVQLINDAFTTTNNRDYFVSLNGLPRTGAIYNSVIPSVHAMAVNSGNGYMDVLLTPEADYFGWVNSIDFTLRWPAGSGSFGAIVQEAPMQTILPMAKVGGEVTEGGFTYQRFHGNGNMSLAVGQSVFLANEDHRIMRLPIVGEMVDAAVASDGWTSTNEGAYDIVLNGIASAGGTDESTTSTGPLFQDIIPQMMVVGDELRVHTAANGQGFLVLSLLSANGQPIMQRRAKWGVLERFNLAGLPAGMYMLKANFEQGQVARRFVY